MSAAVSAADERAVCSMYPPQRARARLARTPARITKLLALRSRRSHYEASRAHMHEDVSAHGYRCVASMCTRNAVPGGNGGCHGVGWGVAGVLERVVHLLRSRPAVCSLRRLGVWAQRVPCEGCRAGRPFAFLAGPRWPSLASVSRVADTRTTVVHHYLLRLRYEYRERTVRACPVVHVDVL